MENPRESCSYHLGFGLGACAMGYLMGRVNRVGSYLGDPAGTTETYRSISGSRETDRSPEIGTSQRFGIECSEASVCQPWPVWGEGGVMP